jgi:hypothetical protein
LVVLDPGTHERGLPAVNLAPVDGGMQIDIPPAVHVHRYYYSGDKEVQGPIISGGPTVVVANHPKTGERMYIDVVLPAGAPRIAYSKHAITYVYPNRRVAVNFQSFPLNPEKVVVRHLSGKGWGRSIQNAHEHVSEHVHESLSHAPVVQSVKECAGDTADMLSGAKVSAGNLTVGALDAVKSLTNLVPGVTYLHGLSEQKEERGYASSIRGAAIKKEREEPVFVPTNR